MELKQIRNKFKDLNGVQESIQKLENRPVKIQWKGIHGGAKAFTSAAVAKEVPGHHLFILQDKEEAAYFLNDLQHIFPDDERVVFYPASYKVPYKLEKTDNANVVGRAEALDHITKASNMWIVTYPKALFEQLPTQKKLASNSFKVEKGREYDIEFLNEFLMDQDFQIVDFVYEPGQFAIRGGIVDVFSYSNDLPFRLEFFGDELETIRSFDPVSQLSEKTCEFFHIVPDIQHSLEQTENGSFLSFIGASSTIWMSSYKEVKSQLETEYTKAVKIYSDLPDSAVEHHSPNELFYHPTEWEKEVDLLSQIEWGPDYTHKDTTEINFGNQPQPSFNKNFDLLTADLKQRKKQGYTNLIFSNQPKQIERLHDIFRDIKASVDFTSINASIHEGFISDELKLVCYTDHQIFERYHRFRLKEGFRQAKQALTLKEIYNLQKGDYVTHIDHGVGRFSGLEMIDVNGKQQEAIRLIYKDNDVLYVSIHSLHRISKFSGKDGTAPKMNKLGTQTWAKLKRPRKKLKKSPLI